MYCNVVATKNFKSTKPYLVMKQQQQRIITFIDYYYDYTFSDVNVECKYFILMLDQLFGAQPLQKQTNPKNGLNIKWPIPEDWFLVNVEFLFFRNLAV